MMFLYVCMTELTGEYKWEYIFKEEFHMYVRV